MTSTLDRLAPPSASPDWVGQGTAIEQSRAIEEVRAAIIVAQQRPRDEGRAVAAMRRACAMPALAKRSFFAFPRGKETVSGPSVYLARELARCWGNISHGGSELRRDDERGFSEMQAFAWDLETNTRSAQIFIVPHRRDAGGRAQPLTQMRDIYENNANAGARRLREAIFSVLPQWYTDEAKELCHHTLTGNDGDLLERIEKAVRAFERSGITVDQLEAKLGRPRARWRGEEYAQLDVLYGSLRRGEITRDEAFPPARVTAADIVGSAAGRPAAEAGIEDKQRKHLHVLVNKLEFDRDTKLAIASEIVGRALGSTNELTAREAAAVIAEFDQLAAARNQPADAEQGWSDVTEPPDGER